MDLCVTFTKGLRKPAFLRQDFPRLQNQQLRTALGGESGQKVRPEAALCPDRACLCTLEPRTGVLRQVLPRPHPASWRREECPQDSSRWQQGRVPQLSERGRGGPQLHPSQVSAEANGLASLAQESPPCLRPRRPTPLSWPEGHTQQGSQPVRPSDLPHAGHPSSTGRITPSGVPGCGPQGTTETAATGDVTSVTLTGHWDRAIRKKASKCSSGGGDGKRVKSPPSRTPSHAQCPGGPGQHPKNSQGPRPCTGRPSQSPGNPSA